MTKIAPRKFYDDVENLYEIKKALNKKRYNQVFKFLHEYFFNEHKPLVNNIIIRMSLCISDRVEAHQILDSLTVLNLLEKQRVGAKRVFYAPINEEWWHKFKKEMNKNGYIRQN